MKEAKEYNFENDLYSQIINQLSNDWKQSADQIEKSPKYRWVWLLLSGLFFSILFASLVHVLHDKTYWVIAWFVGEVFAVIVSLFLNSHFRKKFSKKQKAITLSTVITLSLAMFYPPSIVDGFPNIYAPSELFFLWGFLMFIVAALISLNSFNVVSAVELGKDLVGTFLPILPTTFGKNVPDVAKRAYMLIYDKVHGQLAWKDELEHLKVASQAELDSLEVRSLPWVVVLGFGLIKWQGIWDENAVSVLISMAINVVIVLFFFVGLYAVLNIARLSYYNTVIIQMSSRIYKDMVQISGSAPLQVMSDKLGK